MPELIVEGERAARAFASPLVRFEHLTIPHRNAAFRDETHGAAPDAILAQLSARSTLVIFLHALRRVNIMSWLDMSEYLLIETAARDRVSELHRDALPERRPKVVTTPSRLRTMLYVSSARRAKPRDIDRYIDYFGDSVLRPR
jgi:hypothetical protein